jgi:putative membrane protein
MMYGLRFHGGSINSMFMGGGIYMFIFWILIIILIIGILKKSSIGRDYKVERSRVETPIDILKKRYAAGELTESAYLHMKEKLRD